MALGLKFEKVKFNNTYNEQTLFEAIKDTTFAAGKPELVKHGFNEVIVFPALDSHNQVQVIRAEMKAECSTFRVYKAEEAGVSTMAANAALDKLTGGLFGLKSIAGKNAKEIVKLVEETAEQLRNMGL